MFEQHTVFENLELAMKTDKRVRPTLFARLTGEQADRIGETLDLIRLRPEAFRPPACCRMARSNGWRSACC